MHTCPLFERSGRDFISKYAPFGRSYVIGLPAGVSLRVIKCFFQLSKHKMPHPLSKFQHFIQIGWGI